MTSQTQTLYQRLGGVERISAIIDGALDRHAVHPVLAPRFHGKDLQRLKQLGTQFFCAGTGGPQAYEGRDLRAAHTGMNVSEQEFMATIDDIVAAMDDQQVGAAEAGEVVAILYSLRGDVMRI